MKIKKNYFIVLLFSIALLLVIFYLSSKEIPSSKEVYSFNIDSMNYSTQREIPKSQISLRSSREGVDIYNISFTSKPFINYTTTIFGLYFTPSNNTSNLPGLIFLPGGGVKKESLLNFATQIAKRGYSILIIDQRGIGETGGYYLDPQNDFKAFASGYEPIQHLSVYDGLRGYDVLKTIKGVDKNNIAIAGESMGGRYAIIAASLDKNLKGAIIISSSGFHIPENSSNLVNNYLVSIDPDHYINKITPRYLFMLQGDNDSVVKIEDAKLTYSLAGEKKSFFIARGCPHGYCKEMEEELYKDLKIIFS